MNFKVYFESEFGRAAHTKSRSVGINILDMIREQIGVSDLDPSRVIADITGLWENLKVEIPESLARRSGRFYDLNHITVKVKSMGLNNFVELQIIANKNKETGEIIEVRLVQLLNKSAVLTWWESLGFPIDTTDTANSEDI